MKLRKAIEILEHKVKQNVFQVDPDAFTALKLGIEALKRHQERQARLPFPKLNLLPGETEE